MPEYCICRSGDGDRFMIECDNCDEWFHGDCINLRQTEAKNIEKYFCKTCVDKNPNLKITYRQQRVKKSDGAKAAKTKEKSSQKNNVLSQAATTAVEDGSTTSTDTGDSEEDEEWDSASQKSSQKQQVSSDKLNGAPPPPKKTKDHTKTPPPKPQAAKQRKEKQEKQEKTKKAKKTASSQQSSKNNLRPKDWTGHGMPPPLPIPGQVPQQRRPGDSGLIQPDIKSLPKIGRKSMNSLSTGYTAAVEESVGGMGLEQHPSFSDLRQCLGPKCRFGAAADSKYCSAECGRALARKRLMELMPARLAAMGNTTYAATLRNQEEMDGIHKRLADCKKVLDKLVERKAALEEKIAMGKGQTGVAVEEKEEQGEEDNCDVACITCGQSVALKTAIKHFERCFNRFENQTSYGSIIPTTSDIFCNYFNPKSKTYCRRLKVLCPEHLKEPVEGNQVCGFPLVNQHFLPTSHFCHVSKKSCSKHPSWERIKRAEIDLETLRTWMKMDDLAEQERVLMLAIRARGGIVQCMTNFTISHQDQDTSIP